MCWLLRSYAPGIGPPHDNSTNRGRICGRCAAALPPASLRESPAISRSADARSTTHHLAAATHIGRVVVRRAHDRTSLTDQGVFCARFRARFCNRGPVGYREEEPGAGRRMPSDRAERWPDARWLEGVRHQTRARLCARASLRRAGAAQQWPPAMAFAGGRRRRGWQPWARGGRAMLRGREISARGGRPR